MLDIDLSHIIQVFDIVAIPPVDLHTNPSNEAHIDRNKEDDHKRLHLGANGICILELRSVSQGSHEPVIHSEGLYLQEEQHEKLNYLVDGAHHDPPITLLDVCITILNISLLCGR